MKNAGLTIGMCAIGLGLASIGFNLNGNTANATPAAFNAGPAEPTIVWYEFAGGDEGYNDNPPSFNGVSGMLLRAWSDGTVEGRLIWIDTKDDQGCAGIFAPTQCPDTEGWFVISSRNEGLNARADLNFDERVDAADIGLVLAAWGDAPRNDYPPSDCPLGLIP